MQRSHWIVLGAVIAVIAVGLLLHAVVADNNAPSVDTAEAPQAPEDDPYAQARNRLVDGLVQRGYLETKPVIRAMRGTKRHLFVPPEWADRAYDDHPLPIGHDQTISAPSIVAMMTELIKPGPKKSILEIGTGSGYQAAVLARLCKHVYTIEIVEQLGKTARVRLKNLGYDNASVRIGDGYKGWPKHAPFDGIMVTCAPEKVPEPLVQQLKEGGRMVIPVGKQWNQYLYVLVKKEGKLERKRVLPVIFVPMTGEVQDQQ